MIDEELEYELLRNAEVLNVVLLRDATRQLILSSGGMTPVAHSFDLRDASALSLIRDALRRLATPENETIRVIGQPVNEAGLLIEITMPSEPLRMALIDYGLRILALSAFISIMTAALLFISVRYLLVVPIKRVVGHMTSYAEAPEDASRIIVPQGRVRELRDAENALQSMQTQLTNGAPPARAPRPAGRGRGQDQPRPAQHPVGHDADGRPARRLRRSGRGSARRPRSSPPSPGR